MLKINDILTNWLSELENFRFPDYERFPDIDLYMDQVITYLDHNLSIFQTSSLDKQITSSMINNYVKGNVITAPISKKYNKEHLALIEETFALKQVLSISEIKQILNTMYEDENNSEAFNSFKKIYTQKNDAACQEAKQQIKNTKENDKKDLTEVALNLATTANAYITIAKRILFLLKKNDEIMENEKKTSRT